MWKLYAMMAKAATNGTFTTAPPETRGGDSKMVPRGIDGTAAVALAGPL